MRPSPLCGSWHRAAAHEAITTTAASAGANSNPPQPYIGITHVHASGTTVHVVLIAPRSYVPLARTTRLPFLPASVPVKSCWPSVRSRQRRVVSVAVQRNASTSTSPTSKSSSTPYPSSIATTHARHTYRTNRPRRWIPHDTSCHQLSWPQQQNTTHMQYVAAASPAISPSYRLSSVTIVCLGPLAETPVWMGFSSQDVLLKVALTAVSGGEWEADGHVWGAIFAELSVMCQDV
jgi:hypothetical protein